MPAIWLPQRSQALVPTRPLKERHDLVELCGEIHVSKSFWKKHGSRVVRIGQTVGNVGRILVIGRHGVDIAHLDRLERGKVIALVFGLFRNNRQIARIQKNQIGILLQHKLQIRFVKALSIQSVGNTASADGRKRSEAAVGARQSRVRQKTSQHLDKPKDRPLDHDCELVFANRPARFR